MSASERNERNHVPEPRPGKPRSHNTSGYLGVSRGPTPGTWAAYIRRNGTRHYLGLFDEPEAASRAYRDAEERLAQHVPDPRDALVEAARRLYEAGGLSALTSDALSASGITSGKLKRVGLSHAQLLGALNLSEDYAAWQSSRFTYAGQAKSRWDWDGVVSEARRLAVEQGDLPTVQWCRLNGHDQLPHSVYRLRRTWEDLRLAIGLPATVMRDGKPRYFDSRSGIRWRSRPEACLSNYLHARGIEHRRGDRYPAEYEAQFGRLYGRYDLHFKSMTGQDVDIEIWGDIPDAYSRGRYARTRTMKEEFNKGRDTFLGIHYLDCQSDDQLTEILKPFIGCVAPFNFESARDERIESAHWSDADDALEACRRLAATMPDGIFPNEQWLRKRGKYVNRPGEPYNTLASYVQKHLGGTRNVREFLGQAEASTTRWSPESVVSAWREFETKHDFTPAQCKGANLQGHLSDDVAREGARIYEVARRLGVVEQARGARRGRKTKWTPQTVEKEWRAFILETGQNPTQCMSQAQRKKLPRVITDRATNLYGAARRLGLLEQLRAIV